jgi:hypothetical protein
VELIRFVHGKICLQGPNHLGLHKNTILLLIKDKLPCVMCSRCPMETTKHLFFHSSYAARMWHLLSRHYGVSLVQHDSTVDGILRRSRIMNITGRRRWEIVIMAGCWFLWKGRNGRIFNRHEGTCMCTSIIAEGCT